MNSIKLHLLLVVAVMLVCSVAQADILDWKGFQWDTQPRAGYTAGSTILDTASNQIWQDAHTAGKIDWINTPAGERFSFAKMVNTPSGISSVYARVYENSNTVQGPSFVIFSDSGQILSVGCHPSVTASYYYLDYFDGTTWAMNQNRWITRGKTSFSNYLAVTYAVNAAGGIDITADYSSSPAYAYNGTYNWSTPGAFGNISQIWLAQAETTTPAHTAKWTDFQLTAVPEPSSMIALLAGLPMVGFAIRRKK